MQALQAEKGCDVDARLLMYAMAIEHAGAWGFRAEDRDGCGSAVSEHAKRTGDAAPPGRPGADDRSNTPLLGPLQSTEAPAAAAIWEGAGEAGCLSYGRPRSGNEASAAASDAVANGTAGAWTSGEGGGDARAAAWSSSWSRIGARS